MTGGLTNILQAVVITLREGIEAALVIGILVAHLRKTNREKLSRFVLLGLAAAVVASVVGAILIQRYGLDPENEVIEGSVMFLAAGLVGSLVVWMWRAGRSVRQRLERRVDALVGEKGTVAIPPRAALGMFTVAFLMVFREGIETVLFLAALSTTIGANPLYNALGGGLGLLLAALFGYLLVQGSVRINLHRFFSITGIVLLLLVAKLVAGGLHEFFEIGLLRSSPELMAIVGLLTRDSASVVLLILLIALPSLCLAWDGWQMPPPAMPPGTPVPERRKLLVSFRRARRWTFATAAAALTISVLLGSFFAAQAARGYDPAPVVLTPENGVVRMPVPTDRKIHKYVVQVDGTPVRFFVLERDDGTLASAFDVCFICPAKGYRQDGKHVTCNNCDAPINIASIGLGGGCNPIPLKVEANANEVTVPIAELAKGRDRFAGK